LIRLREATLEDLPTLLEFEKALIAYEKAFTPNLKETDFNYYDLGSYIQNPGISVVVAEDQNQLVASGYALSVRIKSIKILRSLCFLGLCMWFPNTAGVESIKKYWITFLNGAMIEGFPSFSWMSMHPMKVQ
jgi:hypothetical protein